MGARIVDQASEHLTSLTFTGVLRANVTQFATIRVFEQRFKLDNARHTVHT
jgi:hypothetical protein